MAMCPSCNRFVSATMNKDYTVQVEFDEYMIYLSVSHNGCQFQSIRIKDPLVEIPQIVMALASYYYNHVMPHGSTGEKMNNDNPLLAAYNTSALTEMLESLSTLASIMHGYYSELVRAGFSEEQALELAKDFHLAMSGKKRADS